MSKRARTGLGQVPGYARFWWASSVSEFGTYITSLAVQVLIVTNLSGTSAQVGLVSGARWLPYMLFGLVAGVFVDRVRRRPVMVAADLARGALLILVPILALADRLSIWVLAAFMAVFGLFSLIGDAASQALVPRLVPAPLLTRAHARLDQSSAVAQTSGPALAGGLVALVGAPFAVLVDAASYLFSGLMLLTIKVAEPEPDRAARAPLQREIVEGLAWVYRHPTLAPLALGTHAWFIVWGVSSAVLVPFVLTTLHLSPLALGLVLSMAGIGGLAGSLAAVQLGERFGAGWVVIASRVLTAIAYVSLALAPEQGPAGWFLAGLGQLILGLSMGAENANSMGYRQAVTPDRLQGRMNATMRSINRAMIVVAAPLGGLLADAIGYRTTVWIMVAGFSVVALGLGLSRFRTARQGETPPA